MMKLDSKVAKKSQPSKRPRRREIQVVACPSAFPTERRQQPVRQEDDDHRRQRPHKSAAKGKEKVLDWHETAREIRSLGATAFEGHQKRSYQQEEYERLTGRKMKLQKVPRHIQRGIRRKAEERHKRKLEEARDAGLVLPSVIKKKKERKRDTAADVHGPAPSIGFMQGGMLRLKSKPK